MVVLGCVGSVVVRGVVMLVKAGGFSWWSFASFVASNRFVVVFGVLLSWCWSTIFRRCCRVFASLGGQDGVAGRLCIVVFIVVVSVVQLFGSTGWFSWSVIWFSRNAALW